MIIHYKIKYKQYPHSPKATARSRILGILTAWPMYLAYGIFWYSIVGVLLTVAGLSRDTAYLVALISLVYMVVLIGVLRKVLDARIDAFAASDALSR